jgi:hypothetical protein
MNDFIKKLDFAHDVYCPICGTKASYVLTGGHGFNSIYCHEELNELIDRRIAIVFKRLDTGGSSTTKIK